MREPVHRTRIAVRGHVMRTRCESVVEPDEQVAEERLDDDEVGSCRNAGGVAGAGRREEDVAVGRAGTERAPVVVRSAVQKQHVGMRSLGPIEHVGRLVGRVRLGERRDSAESREGTCESGGARRRVEPGAEGAHGDDSRTRRRKRQAAARLELQRQRTCEGDRESRVCVSCSSSSNASSSSSRSSPSRTASTVVEREDPVKSASSPRNGPAPSTRTTLRRRPKRRRRRRAISRSRPRKIRSAISTLRDHDLARSEVNRAQTLDEAVERFRSDAHEHMDVREQIVTSPHPSKGGVTLENAETRHRRPRRQGARDGSAAP